MKTTIIITMALLPSIICCISAGLLFFHGISGGGWFLFAAVLVSPSISIGKDGKKHSIEDMVDPKSKS